MSDEEDKYRNDHRLNSRPLDVHRWSDHPEVKQLIDQLWDVFTGRRPSFLELGVNSVLTSD